MTKGTKLQNASKEHMEGMKAREHGKSIDSSPYKHFGPPRNEWRKGWEMADAGELHGIGDHINTDYQNGCSKALTHIQNKAAEAGVKLENSKQEALRILGQFDVNGLAVLEKGQIVDYLVEKGINKIDAVAAVKTAGVGK